jgi:hypothetical protein
MRGAGQLVLCSLFFVERRHKMGIRDWDIVTSYVDSVTTSLKTVTFPKVQEQVKVKNQGNTNLTYTIGSQSGTLTPGQSVMVKENVSSFNIQAVAGVQSFEVKATEQGTEIVDTDNNLPSDVSAQLNSLTTSLATKASKTDLTNIGNGSPKGVYATLTALQTAFPTGTTGIYIVTADGKWYYWSGSAWTAGGVYQSTSVATGSITPDKTSFFDVEWSKNLLEVIDGSVTSSGLTVTIANGVVTLNGTSTANLYLKLTTALALQTFNSNYKSDVYNKLSLGSQYAMSAFIVGGAFSPTCAWSGEFKDTAGNNLLRVAYNSLTSAIAPINVQPSYLLLYLPTDTYNNVKIAFSIEKDNNPTQFIQYNTVTKSSISKQYIPVIGKNEITVKKDGTGNFTRIVDAVASITDASKDKPYTINIYSGEYDIFQELGGATYLSTITSSTDPMTCGITLPPYVHLKGIGKPHLKLEIDVANTTNNAVSAVSCLNVMGTNTVENLFITVKNCRYGIHDESGGNPQYYYHDRIIRNCKVVHYGNDGSFTWQQSNPYANGFDVGNTFLFENCEFTACKWGNAWSCHDRVSNTDNSRFEFNNCKFSTVGTDTVRFGSVSRGNSHDVIMRNCDISDRIVLNEETANSGVGCAYVVKGSGNKKCPHVIINTNATDTTLHYPVFSGEKSYIGCRNEKTKLTARTPYRNDQNGSAYPATATGNFFDFIPLEDITPLNYGLVFEHGYIDETILGITTAIGNQISFVNGAFVVGNTNVVGINNGKIAGQVLIY